MGVENYGGNYSAGQMFYFADDLPQNRGTKKKKEKKPVTRVLIVFSSSKAVGIY